MSLAKRPRGVPQSEFDWASADIVNVATQTLHTLVDMDTIREQLDGFAYNLPTHTMRLSNLADYQPLANGPVFRMLESRGGTVMSLQVINGLDARQAAAFPGDPEMARWALRRTIQPLGVAAQNSEMLHTKDDPDLGVIKSGTQTCEAYGAVGGMRACFDIPPLGAADPRTGSVIDGTDCKRQTLYTRPMNPSLTATTFNRAMAHIIHSPQQWSQAMSGYSTSANVWLNAAKARLDASLFKALLFVYLLAAEGKIRGVDELDAPSAEEMIERLAQYMMLTPDRGAPRGLTTDRFDTYKLLKVKFARKAFYVPTQDNKIVITDEYGYFFDQVAGRYTSRARAPDMRELLQGTPAADLVNMQLNANTLEVAAFVEAVNEDERWAAGSYFSSSNVRGSNKAHLSLGVCS